MYSEHVNYRPRRKPASAGHGKRADVHPILCRPPPPSVKQCAVDTCVPSSGGHLVSAPIRVISRAVGRCQSLKDSAKFIMVSTRGVLTRDKWRAHLHAIKRYRRSIEQSGPAARINIGLSGEMLPPAWLSVQLRAPAILYVCTRTECKLTDCL